MRDDSKAPGEWPAAVLPYAYVPGHGLPHPVNDPAAHSFGRESGPPIGPEALEGLPADSLVRRRAIAGLLAAHPEWHRAAALLHEGFFGRLTRPGSSCGMRLAGRRRRPGACGGSFIWRRRE